MKKYLLSFAILLSGLHLSAETFTTCSLTSEGATHKLSFTVKSESNIRYYVVEAGRDSLNYDVVATVPARGNTTLSGRYTACSYDTGYRYYRVRQVDITAGNLYSPWVSLTAGPKPVHMIPAPVSGQSISFTSALRR